MVLVMPREGVLWSPLPITYPDQVLVSEAEDMWCGSHCAQHQNFHSGWKRVRESTANLSRDPYAGGEDRGRGYLSLIEKLPDQVFLAIHTSGHDGMGRDPGQVAPLVLVHRPPGVFPAEQFILVPVGLVSQVL